MTAPLRIAVVGAGAIGGWVAALLTVAGHQVSAVARGRTLAALNAHGLRLLDGDREVKAQIRATEDAAELGPQDIVVVAVKGPALIEASASVAAMLSPGTAVVTMMNGVPWWFLSGALGEAPDQSIAAVDPDGTIARNIPSTSVVGCVVHASCVTTEPGRIVHKMGDGLILGEAAGGLSDRIPVLASVFAGAGFDVTVSERIQRDIWYKLWGNITMNPISAITGATCDRILDDDLVRGFVLGVMAESAEIGRRIGCPIAESGEDRNAVTRKLGAFKTSMLQDVEADRPLEIDALLAAPREIAARLGVPTPNIDALLGLTRLFGRTRGLYPA